MAYMVEKGVSTHDANGPQMGSKWVHLGSYPQIWRGSQDLRRVPKWGPEVSRPPNGGSWDLRTYIYMYIYVHAHVYKCTYTFIYPYTPPIQPRAYTLYVGVWGTSYTMWGGPKRGIKVPFGVPTLDLRGSQDLRGSSKWEVLRSEDLQIHGFDLIFRGLDLF